MSIQQQVRSKEGNKEHLANYAFTPSQRITMLHCTHSPSSPWVNQLPQHWWLLLQSFTPMVRSGTPSSPRTVPPLILQILSTQPHSSWMAHSLTLIKDVFSDSSRPPVHPFSPRPSICSCLHFFLNSTETTGSINDFLVNTFHSLVSLSFCCTSQQSPQSWRNTSDWLLHSYTLGC